MPLLVEAKELIPDSGGPGYHRGGVGQRVRVRTRRDEETPALIGLHPQGMLVDTPGLFGGQAGRRANVRLEEGDAVQEGVELGGLAELRRPTQRLTIELAGGSGYGDPRERPLPLVQRDLDAGVITPAGAGAYGCEVDATGEVIRAEPGRQS